MRNGAPVARRVRRERNLRYRDRLAVTRHAPPPATMRFSFVRIGRRRTALNVAALLLTCPIAVSACARSLEVAERLGREANASERGLSDRPQPNDRKAQSPKAGFRRKRVAGKSAPSDLVADDGTRCAVSAEKFEQTNPGDRVWCRWTDPLNPSPPQTLSR